MPSDFFEGMRLYQHRPQIVRKNQPNNFVLKGTVCTEHLKTIWVAINWINPVNVFRHGKRSALIYGNNAHGPNPIATQGQFATNGSHKVLALYHFARIHCPFFLQLKHLIRWSAKSQWICLPAMEVQKETNKGHTKQQQHRHMQEITASEMTASDSGTLPKCKVVDV